MRGRPRPGGVSWGPPPPTPVCLSRRETGLTREPYRAVCLAVRSVCAGRGRRRLRRCLARADAADAEYNVDRVYLHVPAKKSVLVAPSFGRLDLPNSFLPFFSGLQRKDDRCTTLVERPHPYEACRPLAFSLHWWQGATDLEVLDIRRRRVVRRVTLLTAGEQQREPGEARREQQREPGEARREQQREPGTGRTNHRHAVKYIHHDLERNELVMMSVQTEEALASVIVFRLQPLEFLVHFQVLRRNFPHADTLTVGEGVVMMTSRSRGIVSLYSLDTILQERSFVAGLGDEVTVKGRRYVIGQRPHGLPINGQLPAAAPPIATFPAYQGFLELGASPYHIVTRRKQSEGFEVRAMLDGALVLTTEALQSSVGAEAATFVDDGPFLVQHSTSELRVFDLRSGQTVLQVDPASFSSWSLPAPSGPITTRSPGPAALGGCGLPVGAGRLRLVARLGHRGRAGPAGGHCGGGGGGGDGRFASTSAVRSSDLDADLRHATGAPHAAVGCRSGAGIGRHGPLPAVRQAALLRCQVHHARVQPDGRRRAGRAAATRLWSGRAACARADTAPGCPVGPAPGAVTVGRRISVVCACVRACVRGDIGLRPLRHSSCEDGRQASFKSRV